MGSSNRYVWCHTKQSDSPPWITLPLNLLPIVCTDVLKIKILELDAPKQMEMEFLQKGLYFMIFMRNKGRVR
ncbi:no exine formation protein, partial [Trifolium medium]|nr:no exine formation protein [Trifolium medium]